MSVMIIIRQVTVCQSLQQAVRYGNDVISLEQWLACLVAEGGVQSKTPRKIWKYAIRYRRREPEFQYF
jgi:hypothetical protein